MEVDNDYNFPIAMYIAVFSILGHAIFFALIEIEKKKNVQPPEQENTPVNIGKVANSIAIGVMMGIGGFIVISIERYVFSKE